MKKNNNTIKDLLKRTFVVIAIVLVILAIFTLLDKHPSFADSGFDFSYSGGGSSYSGGGSSYSSHSSGGSYSSSDFVDDDILFELILFAIMVIVYFIKKLFEKPVNYPQQPQIINDTEIENRIKQIIPDFNKQQFLENGYKIYCDVQNAWMNFKLEDVRDKITDELFTMYESQLTTLEVKGEQNIMKDFKLNKSFLKGVENQNGTITITTGYIIEFYDYIVDVASGKVLRGRNNNKANVTYEMKFRKTLDESKKVDKCPVCGAPREMNSAGICSYCRSKLVTENTKWVLTQKKTLGQYYK